ncbi:MAG: hypothetical protein EBS38_02675 [Actinobacteria bacterium]|nr:hypothetical protein [Actinomycetota bacterium]
MSMTFIQHTELTGSQNSIVFSSIPTTFTDLLIVCSLRGNASSAYNDSFIQINGDTGANYSARALNGDGSSANSSSTSGASSSGRIGFSVGNNATASTFGSMQIYIPNYRSNTAKSIGTDAVTENNGGAYMNINAVLYSGTSPITSVSINGLSTDFVSGSSATLYGITRGSTPGVTVS